MTVLHPSPVLHSQLHYDASKREFVAEISDFGKSFRFGQVYDDACDTGLTIEGATGREIVFAIWEEHRGSEGDVTHWELRPVKRSDAAIVERVIIFND